MSTAAKNSRTSVEDYLKLEASSDIRHEYANGFILAQAGAGRIHNLVSAWLLTALTSHLKGSPCKVYMSDMKVRVRTNDLDLFYYPDVMVS